MNTKQFKLGVVLSLTTGKLLCEFSELHEAAEYVLGHPVWTHEFADEQTVERIRNAVVTQHPGLADVDAKGVTKENWKEFLAAKEALYGEQITLQEGTQVREESPLESLERMVPGKPVLVLKA